MQQNILTSANETTAFFPVAPAVFHHYMISALAPHLQHHDNILSWFKRLELLS